MGILREGGIKKDRTVSPGANGAGVQGEKISYSSPQPKPEKSTIWGSLYLE